MTRRALVIVLACSALACGDDGDGDGRIEGYPTSATVTASTGSTGGTTGATATASTTNNSTSSAQTTSMPTGSTTDGPTSSPTSTDPTLGMTSDGTTQGDDCIPTSDDELTCDDIDDDCNGLVDDVDLENDGFCDCLAIALIGNRGFNKASQFEQWLNDRGTSTMRIDPPLVDATALAPYDVVILDELTRAYSAAEVLAFEAWVTQGGGLMAMTGHTTNPSSALTWPNGILSPMGIEYRAPFFNGPITDFSPHPITMGLTSVTFLGGIEVAESMPGMSTAIARGPNGLVVAQAQERGSGHLFVWGDEWIEYDSEWATMPEITLLWSNVLDWLTPPNVCGNPPG